MDKNVTVFIDDDGTLTEEERSELNGDKAEKQE